MSPISLLNQFRRWLGESRRNQILAAGAALVAGGAIVAAGVAVGVSRDGGREEQVTARTATPSPAATEAPTRTPRRTATASPTPEPAETLAFIRDGDIWLINADGSGERQLTTLGDVQTFTWISSDEMDVVTGEDRSGHFLVDMENDLTELSTPASGSWSRDGTKYVVPVDQEIVIFDKGGSEAARLNVGPPIEENPEKGDCGIPLYPSGQPDKLAFGQPVFTSDGAAVIVPVNCESRRGVTGFLGFLTYEASLDGSVNRPLAATAPTIQYSGDRSPDGRYVAEVSREDFGLCRHEARIHVATADGTNERELTLVAVADLRQQEPPPDILGGVVGYDWSSASDAVVASFNVSLCDESGIHPILAGLYILKIDGSGEEKLVDGPALSPAWSPSGRVISYVHAEEEVPSDPREGPPTTRPLGIRLLDPVTREIVDLTQGTAPAWQPHP